MFDLRELFQLERTRMPSGRLDRSENSGWVTVGTFAAKTSSGLRISGAVSGLSEPISFSLEKKRGETHVRPLPSGPRAARPAANWGLVSRPAVLWRHSCRKAADGVDRLAVDGQDGQEARDGEGRAGSEEMEGPVLGADHGGVLRKRPLYHGADALDPDDRREGRNLHRLRAGHVVGDSRIHPHDDHQPAVQALDDIQEGIPGLGARLLQFLLQLGRLVGSAHLGDDGPHRVVERAHVEVALAVEIGVRGREPRADETARLAAEHGEQAVAAVGRVDKRPVAKASPRLADGA
jgi:hypothetical protein